MTAAVALAAAAVVMLPAMPAGAHAGVLTRSPADGAVLWSSPTSASVTFTETVTGGSRALIVVNRTGKVLSTGASVTGSTTTARVSSLRPARYALIYDVTSEDGHRAHVASGFSVGVSDPASRSRVVQLGGYSVRLSGDRVGTRTITLPWANAIGEVTWTYKGIPGPFTWTLSRGKASGMLPFAGTYTVRVNAFTSVSQNYAFTGTVRITA